MSLINGIKKHPVALVHAIALLVFIVISALLSNVLIVCDNDAFVENEKKQQCVQSQCNWDSSSYSGRPQVASVTQEHGSNIFAKIISSVSGHEGILPFFIVLSMLIGVYLLLNCLKISPFSAIVGAISFAFFAYGIGELQAGELLEMIAISIMPYVLAGTVLVFNGKRIVGVVILLVFVALQAATCHYQMLYYTLMCVLVYVVFEYVANGRKITQKLASTGVVAVVVMLGVLTNGESILNEYEFSGYATEQLPDYDVSVPSFHDGGESMSMLIPHLKGGKSVAQLNEKSETYQLLEPICGHENAISLCQKSPLYFGKRVFSKGTLYFGALALLLALFGCVCRRKNDKWWLILLCVLSILLSCGNIEYFVVGKLPLFYNSSCFSNILVISAFCLSVLAAMGTDEIISHETECSEKRKIISLYVATGVLAITLLVFVVFPSIAGDRSIDENNMAETDEAEMLASYMPQDIEYAQVVSDFKVDYVNAIRNDRISIIRRDAAKSLVFVLTGFIVAFFTIRKKLNAKAVATTLAVLVLVDTTIVNARDMHTVSSFVSVPDQSQGVAAEVIHADGSTFRVLDINNVAVLDDNTTYKNFNSLSGGDGYCLKRYKTFCDSILNKELSLMRYNILSWAQRDGMALDEIQEVFSDKYKTSALDMLNTKYIILSSRVKPIENKHACGNVWLVDSIRWANSESYEVILARYIDPHTTAIVNEKYKAEFTDVDFSIDSTDYVGLVSQNGDSLIYKSSCKGNRVAVFSEIFYPRGWRVSIDGKKASFFRSNYILRGMIIPQGEHEIVFCYEPKTAKIGGFISLASNISIFTLIAILCVTELIIRLRKKNASY